ncbi:MAG: hypothetical protein ACI9O4_000128 [Chitinophagales bacterium]|jgi:hypothetical protein
MRSHKNQPIMKNLTLRMFFLYINVLALIFVSFAQGNLEGLVLDENSQDPIPFANVALKQSGEIIWSTTTDYDGYFYFDKLNKGNYSFFVYAMGNSKEFTDIKVSNADLSFTLAMGLTNYIDTVIVLGHPGLIQSEDIDRYDPDFIDNIGAINIIDIETLSQSAIETSEGVSYKGARPGTAVYYIDGIRTYGELYMPMSAVASVEIYNGGIPAKFGNSTSAVIVVESKSYFDDY